MRSGLELAKLQIEKQKYVCFEVQSLRGQVIASQPDDTMTVVEAINELDQICEALPGGKYNLLLTRTGNVEQGRAKKGSQGSGSVEIPIFITQSGGHMDIMSHNALAVPGINNKEFRDLVKEINEKEKQILKLEIEIQRLKAENEGGGINGIFNNPNVQNLIAVLAQSYMAKNGGNGQG